MPLLRSWSQVGLSSSIMTELFRPLLLPWLVGLSMLLSLEKTERGCDWSSGGMLTSSIWPGMFLAGCLRGKAKMSVALPIAFPIISVASSASSREMADSFTLYLLVLLSFDVQLRVIILLKRAQDPRSSNSASSSNAPIRIVRSGRFQNRIRRHLIRSKNPSGLIVSRGPALDQSEGY